MYVVRIACPKCSMQQTFRGTPPEIGAAVEAWNTRHQRAIHDDEPGASRPGKAGPGRPPGPGNRHPAPRYDVGKTTKRELTLKARRERPG